MISIKDISKIDIPLVWTFHDMWPFCGGEHFTENNRFNQVTINYQDQNMKVV